MNMIESENDNWLGVGDLRNDPPNCCILPAILLLYLAGKISPTPSDEKVKAQRNSEDLDLQTLALKTRSLKSSTQ